MFIRSVKSASAAASSKNLRRQCGDTMIEVLVTIIIMAVGVLGTAALQITTLKNLSSSHSASVAAILVEDFSDRMRANPVAARTGAYVHDSAPSGGGTNCATNMCSEAALANYDMSAWWDQVTAVLPVGSGEVTRVGTTDTYVLTVRWDEDRSGSSGTNCPTQSSADLECYRFNVTII